MNNTLNAFEKAQRASIEVLKQLLDFLSEGEALGVNIDAHLRSKIEKALKEFPSEKLKVALIGGFSEGKTAIAAAWIEKLDKSSMKISHAESSDEVNIYDIDAKLQIMDTPGLFGFKEKQRECGRSTSSRTSPRSGEVGAGEGGEGGEGEGEGRAAEHGRW